MLNLGARGSQNNLERMPRGERTYCFVESFHPGEPARSRGRGRLEILARKFKASGWIGCWLICALKQPESSTALDRGARFYSFCSTAFFSLFRREHSGATF